MPKRKRLTDNQSELVATYLPQKLKKDRKITTSAKLVLANIYRLHSLKKNWGKRTVFRTRRDFLNDIDAKDKNELIRPRDVLVMGDMVMYETGSDGVATEYILSDDLYALLPSMMRGEISGKFKDFQKCNALKDSDLQIEDDEIISASHNSVSDSELQHLNVPSGTGTGTGVGTSVYIEEYNNIKSLHSNASNDLIESVYEYKEKKDKERKESNAAMQCTVGSDGISDFSLTKEEQDLNAKGTHSDTPSIPECKWSYGEVFWRLRDKVLSGKGFSVEKVDAYINKHFILTGEVSQREWESDLKKLLYIKDSLRMCDDSHTPSAVAPLRGESDSEPPQSSARPPLNVNMRGGSQSDDNSLDEQSHVQKEKCSQNANQTTSVTFDELMNIINEPLVPYGKTIADC